MSRAEKIRQWLQQNPGWHFMGDVCAGLAGVDRNQVTRDVDQMARRGQILAVGKQGTKRYRFGRDARKYIRQGEQHAS
ncbi:hypothetical protein [Stenotrophomonas indicatrix]|jgi:hypothetical protein|uniref:hypothetical protein n=1 Tax=Stenotrophomonas indicatrix TaxID=2045451 RepID=UPI0008B014EF|nr:hypothetical protein [Stenotrophomonas indicatrix]SET91582.1 hypothetical protein SAMN05720615_109227 [Stenotrophomonas indicatrix]SEU12546.1 hypothetical protein SAMN05720615_11821 [Stenotrophomonas indicatrix]